MSDRPARRRATRPRPTLRGASTVAAVVTFLVAVAAVALVMPTAGVAGAPGTSTGRLVTHTAVACPSQQVGPGSQSAFGAGLAPVAGLGDGGSLTQGTGSGAGKPLDVSRGRLADLGGSWAQNVVTGDGQRAAGLFASRDDHAPDAGTTAVTMCGAPGSTWWFTGAGAGLDHASDLLLSNVDVGPAVVDLDVLGSNGRPQTVGTSGIMLAPGESKRIPLTDVAPQTDEIALGVHATRGRVVADVADAFAPRAGAPQGREWLQGAPSPSRLVRLAGLPPTSAPRTLLIANPSDQEAVVTIRVDGANGRFVPTGLEDQTVPPGSVQSVPLDQGIGQHEAVALEVRSQVRVLATVRSVVGSDTTYAAPVAPLAGPAAVPTAPDVTSTLQLTAGELAAKASVAAYDAQGRRVAQKQLSLSPGSTTSWAAPAEAAYVLVTPTTGSVFGAMVYQGKGVSEAPLRPLPVRVVEPHVTPGIG